MTRFGFDPEWRGGDYSGFSPQGLRTAAEDALVNEAAIRSCARRKRRHSAKTDEVFDKFVADHLKTDDANDILYALEASRDYDPGPDLEKIQVCPSWTVNSADDLINPPELGIAEREIKRVAKGRAVVIPLGDKTRGHGSHTLATLVWKGASSRRS